MERIASTLDLDKFLYGVRFVDAAGKSRDCALSNYDPEWLKLYEERGYAEIDPSIAHALTSITPLFWSDEMYAADTPRLGEFKEAAYAYGLECGVTIPVHGPSREVAIFCALVSAKRCGAEAARRQLRQLLPYLCLLALHIHAAAFDIFSGAQSTPVHLTNRERECLRWIAAGKSTWEIGRILDISEHGVTHHIRNVMRKFDCTSRHVAVALASAQKLI